MKANGDGSFTLDTTQELAMFRIFLKHVLLRNKIEFSVTESTEKLVEKAQGAKFE